MSGKSVDLIYYENILFQLSYVTIRNSKFTNNYLLTKTYFEMASIVRMLSNKHLHLQIDNCTI